MSRSHLLAYGLGVITGVLVAWEGARRWERASWAWSWAGAWLAEAVWLAREAAGWIVGVLLVLAAAGALIWWAA